MLPIKQSQISSTADVFYLINSKCTTQTLRAHRNELTLNHAVVTRQTVLMGCWRLHCAFYDQRNAERDHTQKSQLNHLQNPPRSNSDIQTVTPEPQQCTSWEFWPTEGWVPNPLLSCWGLATLLNLAMKVLFFDSWAIKEQIKKPKPKPYQSALCQH